jgi:hypothetical protein
MDAIWDNSTRFYAINEALHRIPHDQTAIGLGFRLRHNPTTCMRCRATIASLELAAIIRELETRDATEVVEIDV